MTAASISHAKKSESIKKKRVHPALAVAFERHRRRERDGEGEGKKKRSDPDKGQSQLTLVRWSMKCVLVSVATGRSRAPDDNGSFGKKEAARKSKSET